MTKTIEEFEPDDTNWRTKKQTEDKLKTALAIEHNRPRRRLGRWLEKIGKRLQK